MDKERDYDEILLQLEVVDSILKDTYNTAKSLQGKGSQAETMLADSVGTGIGSSVISMGKAIAQIVDGGEERVRELIKKVQIDKERFERLRRMAQESQGMER